jgi:predicted nuclease of predicted toxin-antitoxin system
MSLKFFADQCVPNTVIETLRKAEHQVLVLKEHIPRDSPDPMVIATAQAMSAILLSLNGDFSDIVAYPPAKYKGIIALQVKNHPRVIPALTDRLLHYIARNEEMSRYEGTLLLVEPHRIRIRK